MEPIRTRMALVSRGAFVRAVAGLATALAATDAGAVFTLADLSGTAQNIQLQVGSADGVVNSVTFDVINANVSPTPAAVTGVPGNGAPGTTQANAILIQITAGIPKKASQTIQLTSDSSAGLSCVSATCGSTIISFSTVSWTSYQKQVGGAFAGMDIQNGTFTGASGQVLVNALVSDLPGHQGSQAVVANELVFQYNNATLYPSGQYTGRVVYTATNL